MTATAITGMGVVCALGQGVDALTQGLRAGRSGIALRERTARPLPDGCRIGAEIRGFSFDSALERVGALPEERKARALKLGRRAPFTVQTSVVAALEAWSAAALEPSGVDPERVGVLIAGNNLTQQYVFQTHGEYGSDPTFINPRYALQFLDTFHLGVVSELLGAKGEGGTVGGASASGNVALARAHQLLALDLCDVCVVVAPPADLSVLELQALANAGALYKDFTDAPSRTCRPFDRRHNGFVPGEAAACVVLEREAFARARGAPVQGRLLGVAVQLDGNASSDPNVDGEVRTMRRALAQAGVDPGAIDYLNAHGSASPLGDRTEVEAIRRVWGARVGEVEINSTKGLTGHCLGAASLVEAIATVGQLRHGFVHPNANLEEPIDGECRFAGPSATQRPLRHALSNAFGFGGINACVVLGEART
ncbi:beta-ketoacyl-ACP synthase [Corallococcus sp. AB030]|uniref:beta-ketoacyl synthase N-terminal-like domain-containing protein n=1 Tax=Corallococcus TaxID=83461 RepID=UPI000EE499BD|nr:MULTISPECIES: beta-ketoacyl synthase N-terminal-like domain-containing protein [Corallococcus]NRD55475.1 beta-ketoacyl-ACP synthase [Corallococcus exiguus]RKI20284.1 beta-ketoacyl-ACP synthase [Corallococcus sp. AB030]RUO95235.1 beta-ketoacyl-ACP synthase [Corallococcus sp. AB018]